MAGFSSVLKNPEFLKLWTGQIISYMGDRITQMALLGWLIASGQSTGTEMSRITFFHMLPFFLFGQITGPFADRFSRKQVMVVCDLLRAALVICIAFLVFHLKSSSALVYLLVFLAGIGAAFFYPAKLAIIPQLVKTEELQAANALCTITGMVATLAGTYLAGVLIQRSGITSGFIVDASTYSISAALIWWIRVDFNRRGEACLAPTRNGSGVKTIWRYIGQHRDVRDLISLSTILSFLSSFFYIALTVLAVDFLKQGTEGLGKFLGMLGIGMMAGSLFSVWLKRWFRPAQIFAGSFFIISVMTFFAGRGGFETRPYFHFLLFMLGAANAVIMITNDTLLQRISPNRLHGKIFGFRGFCTNGVFLMALLGVAELLRLGSPFLVFNLLAVAGLFVTLLIVMPRPYA